VGEQVTGRSLAHKVFRQYVGRTFSTALAVTVVAYFVGVTALTIACAGVTVAIGLWWLYYVLYGPPARRRRLD